MAQPSKQKRKLARERKKKQDRYYKSTKKEEGISIVDARKGRWMLYLLGVMVVLSCFFIFWNMR